MSRKVLPPLIWASFIFIASHQPPISGTPFIPYLDKLAHFIVYWVLCRLICSSLENVNRISVGTAIGISVIYGALDEFHQSFVAGREPSFFDWIADCTGILVAAYMFTRSTDFQSKKAKQE